MQIKRTKTFFTEKSYPFTQYERLPEKGKT